MNERLQLQVTFDGGDWVNDVPARDLSEALGIVVRYREDGDSGDRCMAGYRLLDEKGRVVFVLAPICCRVRGARLASTGENPESSTV